MTAADSAQVIAVLRYAAQLVVERGFVQGTDATNVRGEPVDPLSDDATCFCAAGALQRAAHDYGDRHLYWAAREALHRELKTDQVREWSDKSGDPSGAEIAGVMRRAAHRLERGVA